jgi:type I restriction enzyme S subunit
VREKNHLQNGWIKTTLGEIVLLNPRRWEVPYADKELLSFIPMSSVEAGTGKVDTSIGKSWGEVKKGYTVFQEGDILFAKITPCMENGKIAIAHNLIGGRGAGSTEFHVLRVKDGINSSFLFNFLLQETYRKKAREKMKGTAGQLRVPSVFLEETPIHLPPISEQQRIVAEIEKQFTRLDAAVDALKRVRTNLRRYRSSVLKAACEGRLVPTVAELAKKEGRSYEPADDLLKRILKERRAKWEADQLAQMKAKGKSPKDDQWKEKYIEPIAPDVTHLPKLPQGWAWATSRVLSSFVTSGSRDWKTFYSKAGALFIRTQDINKNKLNLDNVAFVSLPEKVEGKRSLVQKNDLLIIITGANVGKVASVDKEIPEAYVSQSVALVKLVLPEMAKFVQMSMIAQRAGKTQLENLVYGMGRPVLSLENVQDLILLIPPLQEQNRIVAEADRRFSVIEELETILETNLKKADRLRQSILKRAFEGKLVPQDPKNEPASVLLDRIREERIKSENEVKPKTKAKRQKQKVK